MVSYQWQESLNNRANIAYIGSEDFEVRGNLGVVRQRTHSSGLEQPITMDIMWGSPLKRDGPTRGFFLEVPEDFECCVDGLEKVDRTTGSIHVRYNPFEWFEQRLIVGADISNVKSQTTWPRTAVQPGPFEEDNLGRKEITNHRTELITVDYAATLPLNLTNSLALETSFGAQYNKDDNEIVEASGIEFPVAGVSTIAAAATRTSGEQAIENKTFGAFVQARIGWKDRRFVTGAVRGDDNSAFGKEFDFEEYPKVNFSWLLSEEPFFDLGFVESLKVRGAWGQAGQQPDVFAARRLFEPATGPGGVPTVTPQNIGNPNLKPEVGDEWEVGFESGLLNGRLSLDVTYYRQLRKDAIVQQAALPSRGFPGFQLVNLGKVENSGVELSSQADIVANEDLNWSVGVGFSTTDNEVKEVGDIPPPQLRGTGGAVFTQQRHIEGFPVGSLFLTKVVSAEFDAQGNLVNVMCEGGDPITGGGAPVPCDEAGTAFMGQPVPTWDLSVHTSVDYRNFSLRGLAGGHGGNVKCNGDIAWAHVFFRNTKAINEMSDPILAAYDRMGAVCQAGLVDNGFIKLRSLSGTYRFPDRMAGLLGADNASVNVSVENPAILWMAESHKFGRKVIDPEVTSSNINGMNAYQQDQWPQLQRFIAEVRLTF